MKFKQWFSLLLTLALLVGILCGCGGNGSSLRDDDDDNRPSASSPKDKPTTPAIKIQMSEISYAGSFSEGYAFVELNRNRDIRYCINKKGEIQFQLENVQSVSSFHNGYSFVTDKSGITYLYNTEGKRISAEDFGCSSFITKWTNDFIFIVKTVSDFSGSTDSLGILNYNLEFIVEPSADLYKKFMQYYNGNYTKYLAGYLYNEEKCLNLLTGVENTDLSTMYNNAQVDHPSDLWEYLSYPYYWTDGATYKDMRTDEIVVDLRQYKDTIERAYEFEDGTASLLFRSDTATGRKDYFGVINEKGEFLFDPIELPSIDSGDYLVEKDGDNYLLKASFMAYKPEYTIALVNKNGVIKQFTIKSSRYLYVYLNDGVIQVHDTDSDYESTYTYYTLDMDPLF